MNTDRGKPANPVAVGSAATNEWRQKAAKMVAKILTNTTDRSTGATTKSLPALDTTLTPLVTRVADAVVAGFAGIASLEGELHRLASDTVLEVVASVTRGGYVAARPDTLVPLATAVAGAIVVGLAMISGLIGEQQRLAADTVLKVVTGAAYHGFDRRPSPAEAISSMAQCAAEMMIAAFAKNETAATGVAQLLVAETDYRSRTLDPPPSADRLSPLATDVLDAIVAGLAGITGLTGEQHQLAADTVVKVVTQATYRGYSADVPVPSPAELKSLAENAATGIASAFATLNAAAFC